MTGSYLLIQNSSEGLYKGSFKRTFSIRLPNAGKLRSLIQQNNIPCLLKEK